MSVLEDLSEEEAYLYAILTDPSGVDQAEWLWFDASAIETENIFRLWPFQWKWWHCEDMLQIEQAGRSLGKSQSIKLRGFAFAFVHPNREMVITAPELVHLEPITRLIEAQLMNVRLTREMMPHSRSSITHRPFQVDFINGARIIGRIPQRDGKGVKGIHPIWLELDEASDFVAPGWVELIETLNRAQEGAVWRAHGVTRGVRDYFYKFTQPDSDWTVHRMTAMSRPTWTDQERQEKIEMYGSKDSPDYRRNILGLHGDATNPLFVLARLMAATDTDETSDYNVLEYKSLRINAELLTDRGGDFEGALSELPRIKHADDMGYWLGMDVGYTNHPSEILAFVERKSKDSTYLQLMSRVHLERISHGDQVGIILWLINFYSARGFSMDKMQPVSEPILTPSGWHPIGTLHVGDRVIGSDGKSTEVTGVYPQSDRRVVRVQCSDGSWTRCGPEHLWSIENSRTGKRLKVTTEQLEVLIAQPGQRKWFIPALSGPVEGSGENNLPIDSYLLGLLIGDGNLRDRGVRFSSVDAEILCEVESRLPAGVVLKHTDRCNYIIKTLSHRKTRSANGRWNHQNPLLNALRDVGLSGRRSHEKFVPAEYFRAKPPERLDLLRGIMDADGYVTVKGNSSHIGLRTSSPQLADDVVALVESLGGSARWTKHKTSCNGKPGKLAYRLAIFCPENPFRLSRKRGAVLDRKRTARRFVTSITPEPDEESVCIRVAADDHLYVTRHHLLTHNTGLGLPLFQDIQERAAHLAERIKGYNFSAKILVDFDKTVEVDPHMGDQVRDAGIERNVLEHSSDVLRGLVDAERILLPWDKELIREFQGQTFTIDKSGMDLYGRRRIFSQGSFHALDAARMGVLGWSQQPIEEYLHQDQRGDVMDVFVF